MSTLCDLLDSNLPVFSVHGISQARIPEWVALYFARKSSRTRDQSCVSCLGRRVLNHEWKYIHIYIDRYRYKEIYIEIDIRSLYIYIHIHTYPFLVQNLLFKIFHFKISPIHKYTFLSHLTCITFKSHSVVNACWSIL